MGVWIETLYSYHNNAVVMSHPVWVCGLKQRCKYADTPDSKSHPVWVCGLKPEYGFI